MLLVGCTETPNLPDEGTTTAAATTGALLQMSMHSTVGVLLDEVPAGPLRDAAAAEALARDTTFWTEKAKRQARLTSYRLVFRSGYYKQAKGPLPPPPKEEWHVTLSGSPHRVVVGSHEYVQVDYDFGTYIITDVSSPGIVEPKLGKVGGTWDEPFELPVDPDLLLERTGYACMDEFEFPAGSVFEENTWYFYDQTCTVETLATSSCHVTTFPQQTCVQALDAATGRISPNMHFLRVAYDPSIATEYRYGALHNTNGADLGAVEDGLTDERSIFYRYFTTNSCEWAEGAITQPGWRRLLAFSAIVRNDGTQAVHIGNPFDQNNPWVKANVFVYSQCHQHYHFTHYGEFDYTPAGATTPAVGSKRAFCLEDTDRFHNDEITPLTAVHQTCEYQGIGAGWGDEYNFGIPGQWVDITNANTTNGGVLAFHSNPDQFLCEGNPLDANGNPVSPFDVDNDATSVTAFLPTGTFTPDGKPISKESCSFPSNWQDNNLASTNVSSAGGSFVTEACSRGQVGPLADCGFQADSMHQCTPGAVVNLTCVSHGNPQVFRACEASAALGTGVACAVRDAIANTIVTSAPTAVSFVCPAERDSTNGAGGFSAYHAPVVTAQGAASVTCNGW